MYYIVNKKKYITFIRIVNVFHNVKMRQKNITVDVIKIIVQKDNIFIKMKHVMITVQMKLLTQYMVMFVIINVYIMRLMDRNGVLMIV